MRIPKMCRHKSGQARVILNTSTIYLGLYGTPAARLKYDQVIRAYLANGRRWPPPGPLPALATDQKERPSRIAKAAVAALPPPEITTPPATFSDLARRHVEYQEGILGRRSKTFLKIRRALEMAERSGTSNCSLSAYGPVRLVKFQDWLSRHPDGMWKRSTINEFTSVIVRMFQWAVTREWIKPDAWVALKAVPMLRKRRPVSPGGPVPIEGRKVEPPDPAAIEAVKGKLRPMLAAMVDLQLLTGMRPNELLHIRPADLRKTTIKGVIAYGVLDDANKMAWKDIVRTVYIGPRGMAILEPWLKLCESPEDYVFSPRRNEAMRDAERREARQTPMYPSHSPEIRRKKRPGRVPGERYDSDGYARCISRAMDEVALDRVNAERKKSGKPPLKRLTPEEMTEWEQSGKALKHWTPYQLRHAAATYVTEKEGLDVAQFILGHRSIQTTINYVKVRDIRAAKAARKLG